MVAQAIRRAKSAYSAASISLFGNRLGFGINLNYFFYNLVFRAVSALRVRREPAASAAAVQAATAFQANGFTIVPPFLGRERLMALQRKVDALFSQPGKVVHTLEEGGLTRLRKCLVEVPELETLLHAPEVAAALRAYYGGDFKLFNVDVYRTVPREARQAEEVVPSLLWHFDNLPRAMVKLMVYLRDTKKETGALTLIPKPVSEELKGRGFWDRKKIDQYRVELDRAAVKIEGDAGTVIVFSTHHCIHKATLPETGYRDVAVFLVLPALWPERPWDEAAKRMLSQKFGSCVNPFTNKAAEVGDEPA